MLQQNLNWTLQLQIDNPAVQIYSSNVLVHLKTTSVLTTMYNWPLLSFLLGTSAVFVPVFVALSLATWFAVTRFFVSKQQGDDVSGGDVVDGDAVGESLEDVDPSLLGDMLFKKNKKNIGN